MAAGSIIVDLLMKTGSFETDTGRAEKRLKQLKKEAEDLGKKLGIAFAVVGAASVALVKNAIDAADAIDDLSQKTGVAAKELSALAYAAEIEGVSSDALGGSLVKLTKNMSDAARGTGEAVEGFKALGISVKDSSGFLKSSEQVFSEIAGKFGAMEDSAEKTALAVNLFGKSGAELIPLLNYGSQGLERMRVEAEELGLVIGGELAAQAGEFNDNLARIGLAVRGVATRAATDLLPALNDVSQAFVDMAKSQAFIETSSAIVNSVISGLINVFQVVAVVGSDVGFVFLSIGREIGALVAQMGALATLDINGFKAISAAVKEDGERARKELDKFQARIMAIGQPTDSLASYGNEGRNKPAQTFARGRIQLAPAGKPKKEEIGTAILDPLAATRNTFLRSEKDYEGVLEITERLNKEFDELKEKNIGTAILDPLEDTKNLFLRSEKDYQGASDALADLIEQQERSKSLGQEIGYQFAYAFEDAITGAAKLSDALKRLGQDILRLLVNRFITQAIVGAVDANFGTSGTANRRATGGPVSQGEPYMVGERGPEMFVPNTAGRIVPNGSGGGAVDVQIINNGQPVSAKATTSKQDMRTVVKVVLDAVGASLASGSGAPADGLRSRGVFMDGALPRRA
jgi:hypothetical protein